ncbi:MAG TPA: DNA-binding response regulator [Bacillota bacterium]|nr:DNA-binding response regulator [Bacillota bacterium]
MGFEMKYEAYLEEHLSIRSGESYRRLKEGHGEAEKLFLEKVWWPLFHHFQYLYPEYEVDDFKDGKRYLDYAYIRPGVQICFEIDGYGPHLKNISRWQFADQLERQNHLILDRWMVIRFSYDQVVDRPRCCQQTTQLAISRIMGKEFDQLPLNHIEKEVIRFAMEKGDTVFTLGEVALLLNASKKFTRNILKNLIQKRILLPASGKERICSYRLSEGVQNPFRY